MVSLTGTNFTGATAVNFGAAGPAESFQVISRTEMDATSPPGANTVPYHGHDARWDICALAGRELHLRRSYAHTHSDPHADPHSYATTRHHVAHNYDVGFTHVYGTLPTATVVGIAATSDDQGYWIANNQGLVVACGDAPDLGELTTAPNHPIVGIAVDIRWGGYYLVASDGGIFTFGDAAFYGIHWSHQAQSADRWYGHRFGHRRLLAGGDRWRRLLLQCALLRLNGQHRAQPADRWHGPFERRTGLLACGFGWGHLLLQCAVFGSMGATRSTSRSSACRPMRLLGATGLWLRTVESSLSTRRSSAPPGAIVLNRPILAMESNGTGSGYRFVASDGGIFDFGTSGFFGSAVAPLPVFSRSDTTCCCSVLFRIPL